MNWKRPTNVKRLLSAYATYPAITQVTVIMNNPTTRFNFTHPKVHTIVDHHHEKKLGLAVRFKYCTHAPTEWVLIVDDDILVTQEGLKALMEAKAADPQRLVGWHGRTWTTPVPEYNYKDAPPGPCHVLLTKTILADRANCKAFFKYAPLVAPYVHHYSKPLWNGEDIFLSYASYKTDSQLSGGPGAQHLPHHTRVMWPPPPTPPCQTDSQLSGGPGAQHLPHHTRVMWPLPLTPPCQKDPQLSGGPYRA